MASNDHLDGFQTDFSLLLGTPALPTQTTMQRSGLGISSSRISSTTWPRLRSKLPRSRKPPFEESTTRQGSLLGLRSRLMIRLAGLFDISRFELRPWGTRKPGTLHPLL